MEDLPKVYDILYPSPPSLEQMSAVSLTQQIWRRDMELNKCRAGQRFISAYVANDLWKYLESKLPYRVLRYYIGSCNEMMEKSLREWVSFHCTECIGDFNRQLPVGFVDIVCNFDGSVDYGKTAKRLIRCYGINDVVKFKIACFYCFEDEVYRLWPLVSSHFSPEESNSETSHKSALTHYWISRLGNPSFQLSFNNTVKYSISRTLSSVEYFWKDLSSEDQLELFNRCDEKISFRYLLTKLDEETLTKVANTKGVDVITTLLGDCYENDNEPLALAIWIYTKDEMSTSSFVELAREIAPKYGSYFRQIWRSASHHLKQAAIQDFLRNTSAYVGAKEADFLLAILSDVSIAERTIFWQKSWLDFSFDIYPADLRRVTNFCFRYENEIRRFKEDSMCKYENIGDHCGKLLNNEGFYRLNEFLQYCCPDESSIREVCSKVLTHKFSISAEHVRYYAVELNRFINRAFESLDLATDFKKQLLASSKIKKIFEKLWHEEWRDENVARRCVMKFVDTLEASEEITNRVKNELIELTVRKLLTEYYIFEYSERFKPLLEWCLANNHDGIVRFKQVFCEEEVLQAIAECIRRLNSDMESNSEWSRNIGRRSVTSLEIILKRCFETDEAFEEFRSDASNALLFERIEENSELYDKFKQNQ